MTMAIKVCLILVSVRPKTIATDPVILLHLPDRPQQLQLLLLVTSLCYAIKELHLPSSSRTQEQFSPIPIMARIAFLSSAVAALLMVASAR